MSREQRTERDYIIPYSKGYLTILEGIGTPALNNGPKKVIKGGIAANYYECEGWEGAAIQ